MELARRQVIAVWFSCGAASAVAAKKTVEKYADLYDIFIINNPVDEEDRDNVRFMTDVSTWIGKPIFQAINGEIGHTSAMQVWEDRKYMSGNKGAPCTVLLKKAARHQYELKNKIDFHVLGFTADEQSRHDRFIKYERPNTIPVLIDAGITKEMCFEIIREAGIELPNVYKLGYPNANCIGCVKATSPTYWNHVRKMNPDVFEQRSIQSRKIGARLVRHKGKRIFLDELPPDAVGRKMKSYECGSFCETK